MLYFIGLFILGIIVEFFFFNYIFLRFCGYYFLQDGLYIFNFDF